MAVRVALAADHGGLPLKQDLLRWLQAQGHQVSDLGAYEMLSSDDYPDYAEAVARSVADGQADRGIVICGSGVGACIAANKVPGARAGLCHDTYSAHQGVEHDDMNILCLGARIIGEELAREIVGAYLSAAYTGEERHARRLAKVMALEREALQGACDEQLKGGSV